MAGVCLPGQHQFTLSLEGARLGVRQLQITSKVQMYELQFARIALAFDQNCSLVSLNAEPRSQRVSASQSQYPEYVPQDQIQSSLISVEVTQQTLEQEKCLQQLNLAVRVININLVVHVDNAITNSKEISAALSHCQERIAGQQKPPAQLAEQAAESQQKSGTPDLHQK